jgi:hypothetical protein
MDCCLLRAGFLLNLYFNPEDGGNISTKTLVDFQWTTHRYTEDGSPHNQLCENLKSYKEDNQL